MSAINIGNPMIKPPPTYPVKMRDTYKQYLFHAKMIASELIWCEENIRIMNLCNESHSQLEGTDLTHYHRNAQQMNCFLDSDFVAQR